MPELTFQIVSSSIYALATDVISRHEEDTSSDILLDGLPTLNI